MRCASVIDQLLRTTLHFVLQEVGAHGSADRKLLVPRRIHLPMQHGHVLLPPASDQAQPFSLAACAGRAGILLAAYRRFDIAGETRPRSTGFSDVAVERLEFMLLQKIAGVVHQLAGFRCLQAAAIVPEVEARGLSQLRERFLHRRLQEQGHRDRPLPR